MQKIVAVLGTALLLFGLTCPASFVLGLQLLVLTGLIAQVQRFPISFRPMMPSLTA
jgi:hypothetical protein